MVRGMQVYAYGIRNPGGGLAINPKTGELWCSVNERDALGDNLVPDYITHVQQGGFYGLVLGSVAGVNGATATTKVGIGTTTPTNLLTLGKGFGPSIADGWTTYSSRRWKTNIQPLQNALDKVEQLRGVSYDLKDSGKHEVGVIAEEVGQVVPEVVSYEQNGKDATGVDYSRLTALLIEAAKEQQREIQHQQAALRTQAAAIRDLKSELRATRQTLQKVKAQVAAAQLTVAAAK
jgi:Chaperone of endosialidase